MSQTTADERHWLEANWADTSRAILKIIHPLSNDVIDEIILNGEPTDRTWKRFIDSAARGLDRKRAACSQNTGVSGRRPRSTMYATALSLLGDSAPLRQELISSRPRLEGEGRNGVVWASLRSGLYRMRHRASAESENRSKTWRRLDLISRDVHRQQVADSQARDGESRYDSRHFEALRSYIVRVYPTDHNLPRTLETIEDYFGEFSEEIAISDAFGELVDDSLRPEDIEALPDLNRGLAYMEECIGELEGDHAEVCAVNLQRGPTVDISVLAYCHRTGMDRRKFYRLLDVVTDLLGDCIRGKFAARMMAMPA